MRGVPDTSQGWRPDARAGFVPPHDVGRHNHTTSEIENPGIWTPGASFPSNPAHGDLFYETDTNRLWTYSGTDWEGPRIRQAVVQRAGSNTTLADDNVEYQISTVDMTFPQPTMAFVSFAVFLITEAVGGNYDGRVSVKQDGSVVNALNPQWFITADGGNREWVTVTASAFTNVPSGTVTFALVGLNVPGSSGDVNVIDPMMTIQDISR